MKTNRPVDEELRCESQEIKLLELATILKQTFSDEFINIQTNFRHQIQVNRKGYIAIHILLTLPNINKFFQMIQIDHAAHQEIFIRSAIAKYLETYLRIVKNTVRRVVQYQNRKRIIKPILLENLHEGTTISDIRQSFGEDAFCTKQITDEDLQELTVYAVNYRSVADSENKRWRIIPYELLSRQTERFKISMRVKLTYIYTSNVEIQKQNMRFFEDDEDNEQMVDVSRREEEEKAFSYQQMKGKIYGKSQQKIVKKDWQLKGVKRNGNKKGLEKEKEYWFNLTKRSNLQFNMKLIREDEGRDFVNLSLNRYEEYEIV